MRKSNVVLAAACAVLAVIAIIAGLTFISRPSARTIIQVPFTLEQVYLYGLNAEDVGIFARYGDIRYSGQSKPNHVSLLGVFRGGNSIFGEEVTHKIDAEELVYFLSQTNMQRIPFSSSIHGRWRWSIYLHQNGYIHIIIRDSGLVIVSVRGENRSFIINNSDEIANLLEHMVTKLVD